MTEGENRILIIGAGLAGLTLALSLAKAGIKATVVEKQKLIAPSKWAIYLYPVGMKLFDDLGVLEEMTKLGIPLKPPEMDTSDGKILAVIDTGLLSEPRLNYSLLLGPSEIRQVLRDRAISEGVELLEGVSFKETIRGSDGGSDKISGAILEEDGKLIRISSRVLVGADGYRSKVRGEFRSKTREKNYPAIAGFFLDYEHGLDRMKMILGNGSQMVILPCTKNRLSLGYTEKGLTIRSLSNGEGVEHVKEKMTQYAPYLDRAIDQGIDPKDETTLFIEPKAIHVEPWVVGGGVLIGDAAHAFHPGTGMGAQQAFIDASILSSILIKCCKESDFSFSSLWQFEKKRRPFMNLLESTNSRNVSMQLAEGRFGVWFRNRSFRAVAKLIDRKEYQEIITGVRPPTGLESFRLMAALFLP